MNANVRSTVAYMYHDLLLDECATHTVQRGIALVRRVSVCPHTVNVSLSNQNWMELWRSPQVRLAVEMRTFLGLVEVGFPAHKMEK